MLLRVALYWNRGKHWQVRYTRASMDTNSRLMSTDVDAHGDLLRGLQVVETAAGITSTLLGEKIEGERDYFLPVFEGS